MALEIVGDKVIAFHKYDIQLNFFGTDFHLLLFKFFNQTKRDYNYPESISETLTHLIKLFGIENSYTPRDIEKVLIHKHNLDLENLWVFTGENELQLSFGGYLIYNQDSKKVSLNHIMVNEELQENLESQLSLEEAFHFISNLIVNRQRKSNRNEFELIRNYFKESSKKNDDIKDIEDTLDYYVLTYLKYYPDRKKIEKIKDHFYGPPVNIDEIKYIEDALDYYVLTYLKYIKVELERNKLDIDLLLRVGGFTTIAIFANQNEIMGKLIEYSGIIKDYSSKVMKGNFTVESEEKCYLTACYALLHTCQYMDTIDESIYNHHDPFFLGAYYQLINPLPFRGNWMAIELLSDISTLANLQDKESKIDFVYSQKLIIYRKSKLGFKVKTKDKDKYKEYLKLIENNIDSNSIIGYIFVSSYNKMLITITNAKEYSESMILKSSDKEKQDLLINEILIRMKRFFIKENIVK